MSKKAICLVLAVILSVSIFVAGSLSASAESKKSSDKNSASVKSELVRDGEENASTESTVVSSQQSAHPNLTVYATSNLFPRVEAEYNMTTSEVTVTYWLKLSKDIMSTQWNLKYNPKYLTLSEEKNSMGSICPSIGECGVLSKVSEDTVMYSASSLRLFDFSSQSVPFVKLIFDVKSLDSEKSLQTTVDLTVESLMVSSFDSNTLKSSQNDEHNYVEDSKVVKNNDIQAKVKTTITNSNFVESTDNQKPTRSATRDEARTSPNSENEPDSTIKAEVITISPTEGTVKPVESKPEPPKEEETVGYIDTGSSTLAITLLMVVIAVATVLFVIRKKEMLE